MINKVILIGNLGQDPEVRRLENGAAVAKLNIATNENYKDKNGEWQKITEWHNVVLWRWLAERAEQYLKKGSLVYIEGKLTSRKYQDKDGNDRYITEVVANVMRSLERRESSGSYNSTFPGVADAPSFTEKSSATPAPEPPTAPIVESATAKSGADPVKSVATKPATDTPEDDLPF